MLLEEHRHTIFHSLAGGFMLLLVTLIIWVVPAVPVTEAPIDALNLVLYPLQKSILSNIWYLNVNIESKVASNPKVGQKYMVYISGESNI